MSPLTEPTRLTLAKEFTWNETVWNPSMISTALWLDAADASTVTTVSGNVSQWNDKSGNNRTASQSNSSYRPTYSSTAFNNKPSVVFTGLSEVKLEGSATGLQSSATILAAVEDSGTTNQFAGVYSTASAAGSAGGFGLQSSSGAEYLLDGFGAGPSNTADTSSAINQPRIISGVYTQASTSQSSIYLDGTLEEFYQGSGVSVSDSTGLFQVGGRTFGGQSARTYKGKISELIVLSNAANTSSRQKIEGYLAHKWGLTANLPSDHPYKTVGPTP